MAMSLLERWAVEDLRWRENQGEACEENTELETESCYCEQGLGPVRIPFVAAPAGLKAKQSEFCHEHGP